MEQSEIPGLAGLTELASRDGVDIKPTLLRVMTDLYVQKPEHTAEDEAHYVKLATPLIDQVDAATRAIVAERLANYPTAPRGVIEQIERERIERGELSAIADTNTPAEMQAAPAAAPAEDVVAPSDHESVEVVTTDAITEAAEHATDDTAHDGVSADPAMLPTLAELNEMFLAADAEERRLILLSLEFSDLPTPARIDDRAAQEASRLLETAALSHNADGFAREIERALGISRVLARRLIDDVSGEPVLVLAAALRMPAEALQRVLLCLTPAISHSVLRVYELAKLYEEMDRQSAGRLISIWQSVGKPASRPQKQPPQSQPQLFDDGKLSANLPKRPAIRWDDHAQRRHEG